MADPVDCPECQQVKCANCTGVGLDPETDEFVDCEHREQGHI